MKIVASKNDIAGMNIVRFLDKYELLDGDTIYEEVYDDELIIFASRHASASGTPSLSVHSPGNFIKAEMGGRDKELCVAPALYLKSAFILMNQLACDLDYDITMEVTHHGPYTKTPCFFIEIGSREEQWRDEKAGRVIAEVIKHLEPGNRKTAICFGGTHYCSNFNRIQLESDIALGHICPKYMLEHLDKAMIMQMIERTEPRPKLAILDWKGLGSEKQRLMMLLEETGLEIKRTREF